MLQKVTGLFTGFMALMFGLMASAHAEIPASVGTAFAAIEDDAKAMADIAIPVVIAILGLMIVIKLIKRFGNKI